ncbi:MAG: redoxin domain-containing protein [Verrucomicrobia bacterium]|nr:redoxin domain-containing protein [Verrucomicrobiota bacterium]MBV8276658.1 redoxin domain-containing protein [Verrucomicrobiota bacterium]
MKLGRVAVLVVCLFAGMVRAQAAPAQEQASPSPKAKQRKTAVPNVPRPAPEFLWASVNGKVKRLKDVQGQPVVLIFATDPNQKEFKKQVKNITKLYKALAERKALFFVAFTRETGVITGSDVPFVVLPDPGSAADAYRVGDFGIAVIGPDGNLDYATDRIIPGIKIINVMDNSYAIQSQERRE